MPDLGLLRHAACLHPASLDTFVRPTWTNRLLPLWRGPENRVPRVITIERNQVRRCFKVRVVRAEIPFEWIISWPSVTPNEYFAASFTIEQFQDACATRASESRGKMQTPDGAWRLPRRSSRAMRIKACPQPLQVTKKKMRSNW